jgi:hypothetical protein
MALSKAEKQARNTERQARWRVRHVAEFKRLKAGESYLLKEIERLQKVNADLKAKLAGKPKPVAESVR